MKHRPSYGSLRKTLEAAVEGLDLEHRKALTPEEKLREKLLRAKTSIVLSDALEAFIEGRGQKIAKMGLQGHNGDRQTRR